MSTINLEQCHCVLRAVLVALWTFYTVLWRGAGSRELFPVGVPRCHYENIWAAVPGWHCYSFQVCKSLRMEIWPRHFFTCCSQVWLWYGNNNDSWLRDLLWVFLYFRLFYLNVPTAFCRCWNSNQRRLEPEASTLPTEPQPLPHSLWIVQSCRSSIGKEEKGVK